MVDGDLPPDLIVKSTDLLAPKLCELFNEACRISRWPKIWKRETVIPIPKTSNPKNIDDIRNISLTPYMLKVFERVFLIQSISGTNALQHSCPSTIIQNKREDNVLTYTAISDN